MLGAPRQIGRDEPHAEGKAPLDARLLLAQMCNSYHVTAISVIPVIP